MTSHYCSGCSLALRWAKTATNEDQVWAPNLPPMWFPFPPNEQGRRAGRLYKEAPRLRGRQTPKLALATVGSSLYCNKPSAIHQTSRSRVLHRKVA